MTQQELYDRTKIRVEALLEMFKRKGDEYSEENDPFRNFIEAARLQGVTQQQALIGFVSKQIVSLVDLVKRDAAGKLIPGPLYMEKTGDIIVYMLLLEAMILEKK